MITQLSDRDREREEREKEPSTQMDLNPQPLHHEAPSGILQPVLTFFYSINCSLVTTSAITEL